MVPSILADIAQKNNVSLEVVQEVYREISSFLSSPSARSEYASVPDNENNTFVFSQFMENPVSLYALSAETTSSQTLQDTTPQAYDSQLSWVSQHSRYEDLGLLGIGGMGEVRRVLDKDLNRTMAMKTISSDFMNSQRALSRFIEEAQATAQLQHPGIVPVHELGQLPDGRYYFTMREVKGRNLSSVVHEVHQAATGDSWNQNTRGWSFRKLIDTFHRVCEAVAYAHERGVVHRDLKPDNIMLGRHGEVLVVDWGLAKVINRKDLPDSDFESIQTNRSQDNAFSTLVGAVAGTPAYMSPEQALGQITKVDTRSDVYALGAILYHVLAGKSPYRSKKGKKVLQMVKEGPPPPLLSLDSIGPDLPNDLVAVCEKAMSRDPAQRFATAQQLSEEIAAWLEGARRREKALEIVGRAENTIDEAKALRHIAESLRTQAQTELRTVMPYQPEEDKSAAWKHLDKADVLEQNAALKSLERIQLLQASLTYTATLPEAHRALANEYRESHEEAERRRHTADTSRAEVQLRTHVNALPKEDLTAINHLTYLQGDGALSLQTSPVQAEVRLHRYIKQNRRLVPVFERSLGMTPLHKISLPMGTYLLTIHAPNRPVVNYPIFIERGQHWDGVSPYSHEVEPIYLPQAHELESNDCYIPAGWFWSGGDPNVGASLPRRKLWIDAFVMKTFPVTNAEFIHFLDDLVRQGQEEEALRRAPSEFAGQAGKQGAIIYGRRPDGSFQLVEDSEGDLWLPNWPAVNVDWGGAMAYCHWLSKKTGYSWRLPGELEWEKAARGVDGRFFPWGDFLDPSWCGMRDSHQDRPMLFEVDSYPIDCSPYGVRGMAGNVRDWCLDNWSKEGPKVISQSVPTPPTPESHDLPATARPVQKGGHWLGLQRLSRSAMRYSFEPGSRYADQGFRCLRRFKPQTSDPTTP